MEPSREEALAHFGVKGMRWGVRTNKPQRVGVTNAYVNRQRKIRKPLEDVAEGRGNTAQKISVLASSPLATIVKARGNTQTLAMDRVIKNEEYLQRLESGKATTSDVLAKWATVTLGDLKAARKKL